MKCYALVRPNGDIQKINDKLEEFVIYFNAEDEQMLPAWDLLLTANTAIERKNIWKSIGWNIAIGNFFRST